MNSSSAPRQSNGVQGQTHKAVEAIHVSGKKPELPLFSFSTSHSRAIWIASITSNVLPVERYGKPGIDPKTAGGQCCPFFLAFSFSPALLRHILSLFSFEMTRSALRPAATCHQRGSQPRPTTQPTPADVPEWTLGREEGVGWQNRQREKEPLTEMSGRRGVKKIAIGLGGHYLWSDAGRSVLMSSAGVLTSTRDISRMLQNVPYMQPL